MSISRPSDVPAFIQAVSKSRLAQYIAGADMIAAVHLYLWHCRLCEAFYVSLHFAEVVTRNAIAERLCARLGPMWFENKLLRSLLPPRFEQELANVVDGAELRLTSDELVASMTFGFWQQFMTKRYDRLLWSRGLGETFPFASESVSREDVYRLIDSVRILRNRIAHHRPIFDRSPNRRHQDALRLIALRCRKTKEYVATVSRVSQTLASRPS